MKNRPKKTKDYAIYSSYADEFVSPILKEEELNNWAQNFDVDSHGGSLEVVEIVPTKLEIVANFSIE